MSVPIPILALGREGAGKEQEIERKGTGKGQERDGSLSDIWVGLSPND